MGECQFRTAEYRRDASRTFGRMSRTTLRVTGLEPVFEKVNAQNKVALRSVLGDLARVETILKTCGENPQVIWNEVKAAGGKNHEKAVRMVGMSLGNPNAYPEFPPNPTLMECMRESMSASKDRASCSYTASYGIPQLGQYLKGVNLSDPASVRKDLRKFEEVKVLITAGGSQAAHYGLAPALLRPEHAVAVHDWIYIIHLGAAYYRNATLRNFELRDDGVPDPKSLQEVLEQNSSNGTEIKCVVTTTIGNPIGSAAPREVIVETMEIIRRQSEKEGRPIIAFFDTAYETFRPDGKPLDPIEIAIDEGIEIPVGVFETASKGHGLCGLRLGALRMLWPKSFYPEHREDYFTCLDNSVQPTLGLVPNPIQRGLLEYIRKIETNDSALGIDVEYMDKRRKAANANLLEIARALRKIDGVYLARYYDHSGKIDHIDPNTLASFYLGFGFHGLTKFGAKFNQAKWLAEFSLKNGLPVINCVPGISFLPQERWSEHPALIRITALTDQNDTEAFLKTVAAAAEKI
ncbi:aminotransferase class I/II-fold pyridoxal phosphate-dependent enzyme [Candidatus Micrarchaeota archaeon]|nr:aminotransferase class I/II-fold pyridoxal phosphate-dependent enzyme [Candidatus Micrarchaeota archaeon]MBU1681798.1 aminotransferase class I/II-fold pyridoxal phosphate-dependent enzyme [Candidatus Micrarchaeota archaeon]